VPATLFGQKHANRPLLGGIGGLLKLFLQALDGEFGYAQFQEHLLKKNYAAAWLGL